MNLREIQEGASEREALGPGGRKAWQSVFQGVCKEYSCVEAKASLIPAASTQIPPQQQDHRHCLCIPPSLPDYTVTDLCSSILCILSLLRPRMLNRERPSLISHSLFLSSFSSFPFFLFSFISLLDVRHKRDAAILISFWLKKKKDRQKAPWVSRLSSLPSRLLLGPDFMR